MSVEELSAALDRATASAREKGLTHAVEYFDKLRSMLKFNDVADADYERLADNVAALVAATVDEMGGDPFDLMQVALRMSTNLINHAADRGWSAVPALRAFIASLQRADPTTNG